MKLSDSAYKPLFVNRWFIWGMPFSGKSSLGKKLKKVVPFQVFDLDAEIERTLGKTTAEIFSEMGEDYFRQKETDTLRELVARHDSFLLVSGGGTPCFWGNDEFMLSQGNCLFMDTSLAELKKRALGQETTRPLLKGDAGQRIGELYVLRREIYQKAHATFASEKEGIAFFSGSLQDE